MSDGPHYQVGDIVNGHQWNGTSWMPVSTWSGPPSRPPRPVWKRWWVWVLIGVGALIVINMVSSILSGSGRGTESSSASSAASANEASASPAPAQASTSAAVPAETATSANAGDAQANSGSSGTVGGAGLTASQRSAAELAVDYLNSNSFSRSGLIDQLEFEGYSKGDATAAVDSLDVDWNEQAVGSATSYLDSMAFSISELIDQLEFEGFTSSQARYGAETAYGAASGGGSGDSSGGSVSRANAVRSAESYIDSMPFSRSALIEQLEFEGYSTADATYAVDQLSVDWNEQAALAAASYLDLMPFSRSELIDQLVFDGFSGSQAAYGASSAGL